MGRLRGQQRQIAGKRAGSAIARGSMAKGWLCRAVFILSLLVAYAIVPQHVFEQYTALAAAFLLSFAYTLACVAYIARERAKLAAGKGTLPVVA